MELTMQEGAEVWRRWVLSQTTSGWTRRMQARFTELVLVRWLAVVLLQPVNAFGFIWINCARSLDQL